MSALPQSPHALVTGGGRGIGRAIAAALVDAGATVTVLGRNGATLEEAIRAGAAHFAAVADVSDEASLNAAIKQASARQPIDILIANAGSAESADQYASAVGYALQRLANAGGRFVDHGILVKACQSCSNCEQVFAY